MGVIKDLCAAIDKASARLNYGKETKDLLLFVRPDILQEIIFDAAGYEANFPLQHVWDKDIDNPFTWFNGVPLYTCESMGERWRVCLKLEEQTESEVKQ